MAKAKKTTARANSKSSRASATKKVAKRSTAKRTAAKRATTRTTSAARKTASAAPAAKKTAARSANNADAVLKMSAETVRSMMNAGNKDAQAQMQKQMMNMSQEGAAQLAKSADAASKSMGELFNVSKDNMDTAVTCGSIAVNASKSMGAELFNYANKSFSQNVEMSKEIFGCRTLNDMFDLQSKVMKTNMDHFFNESVKLSEMMFDCANQVSEPLNECVSETTQRISKSLADAA